MHNHNKRNLFLIFLFGRLVFIFYDAIFNKNNNAEDIIYYKNIGINLTEEQILKEKIDLEERQKTIENKIENKIQNQKNHTQDIKTLSYIFKQNGSKDILKEIIKKQAQNYNFNEARENIKKLEQDNGIVDINLLFYVYLNSSNINITEKSSIKNFIPLLNKAVNDNAIGNQEYLFYLGLIEIRNRNYPKAMDQRKQVKIPEYQPIIQGFEKAIKSFDEKKAFPQYYQDGLVSLAALKNGYFTIARKLALETMLKDENYILPYQILSYAHFLTNNRDTAIDYFLKLADFDKKNKETYQFLIGVSYYRKEDYTSSILYLSQNKDTKYQTDTLRYLIVNYLEIDENVKVIESRQKLLGQTDIKNSDFFFYFYNTFYKGYFSKNLELYNLNKSLANLFLQKCEDVLGKDNSVCIYGKIGEEINNRSLSKDNETNLINLSTMYNQSYLYHILGDFYNQKGNTIEAKEWYAKTIASSQDSKEIDFVNKKLLNLAGQ